MIRHKQNENERERERERERNNKIIKKESYYVCLYVYIDGSRAVCRIGLSYSTNLSK